MPCILYGNTLTNCCFVVDRLLTLIFLLVAVESNPLISKIYRYALRQRTLGASDLKKRKFLIQFCCFFLYHTVVMLATLHCKFRSNAFISHTLLFYFLSSSLVYYWRLWLASSILLVYYWRVKDASSIQALLLVVLRSSHHCFCG